VRAAVGVDVSFHPRSAQVAGRELRAEPFPSTRETSDGLILNVKFAANRQHLPPLHR